MNSWPDFWWILKNDARWPPRFENNILEESSVGVLLERDVKNFLNNNDKHDTGHLICWLKPKSWLLYSSLRNVTLIIKKNKWTKLEDIFPWNWKTIRQSPGMVFRQTDLMIFWSCWGKSRTPSIFISSVLFCYRCLIDQISSDIIANKANIFLILMHWHIFFKILKKY